MAPPAVVVTCGLERHTFYDLRAYKVFLDKAPEAVRSPLEGGPLAAESLVSQAHKGLLQLFSTEANAHFQGLHQAVARFKNQLSSQTARRIRNVEEAFAINRHITTQSVELLLASVREQLSGADCASVPDATATTVGEAGVQELCVTGNAQQKECREVQGMADQAKQQQLPAIPPFPTLCRERHDAREDAGEPDSLAQHLGSDTSERVTVSAAEQEQEAQPGGKQEDHKTAISDIGVPNNLDAIHVPTWVVGEATSAGTPKGARDCIRLLHKDGCDTVDAEVQKQEDRPKGHQGVDIPDAGELGATGVENAEDGPAEAQYNKLDIVQRYVEDNWQSAVWSKTLSNRQKKRAHRVRDAFYTAVDKGDVNAVCKALWEIKSLADGA